MAWTTVETPNAKYVLVFSPHYRKAEAITTEFDALVLETGSYEPKNLFGKGKKSCGYELYSNIISSAISKNKQIWITDTPPTKKGLAVDFAKQILPAALFIKGVKMAKRTIDKRKNMGRREFLKKSSISIGLMTPVGLQFLQMFPQKGEIKSDRFWQGSTKYMEFFSSPGVLKIRNAITAEKTERFIAPKLNTELGRKPVIGMVWGPGHYGIKELLQQPKKKAKNP